MTKRRELTSEEQNEALNLSRAWEAFRRENPGSTQTWLAAESGLGTQGAVGQYLRGVIPLNVEALFSICRVIGANPLEISPRLVNRLVKANAEQKELIELGDKMAFAILNLGKRRVGEDPYGDTTPSADMFALVPELDVQASCGPGGKFTDHVVVKGGLAFKHSFLSEVGVPEDQARIVHADGPSMEPTIGHGRVVLVNLADATPKDGKVYLICDEDGGISLKRLVRDFDPAIGATVWKIRSDNPDKRRYPDKFWPEDSRAHIIGRAVWHDGLL